MNARQRLLVTSGGYALIAVGMLVIPVGQALLGGLVIAAGWALVRVGYPAKPKDKVKVKVKRG